jgi:hypothetical protein
MSLEHEQVGGCSATATESTLTFCIVCISEEVKVAKPENLQLGIFTKIVKAVWKSANLLKFHHFN